MLDKIFEKGKPIPLKIIFFILLSFSLINTAVYSQVKISLGPTAGVTVPTADYAGNTFDYYAGTKYGLNPGINFGGIFKATFGPISARASGTISFLSNTGNSEPGPGRGFVEVKHTLIMLTVGPEFAFTLPKSPVKPYAGVDLLFTYFNGETTFEQGVNGVLPATYDLANTSRIGLGFGAGVEYSLGKKYALDFGIRFNLINLAGREYKDLNLETNPEYVRIGSYLELNDEKDPLYQAGDIKHPIGSSRSISTIQFNLAFLFGL